MVHRLIGGTKLLRRLPFFFDGQGTRKCPALLDVPVSGISCWELLGSFWSSLRASTSVVLLGYPAGTVDSGSWGTSAMVQAWKAWQTPGCLMPPDALDVPMAGCCAPSLGIATRVSDAVCIQDDEPSTLAQSGVWSTYCIMQLDIQVPRLSTAPTDQQVTLSIGACVWLSPFPVQCGTHLHCPRLLRGAASPARMCRRLGVLRAKYYANFKAQSTWRRRYM